MADLLFPNTTYRNPVLQGPLDVDNAIAESQIKQLEQARMGISNQQQQLNLDEARRNLPISAQERQLKGMTLEGQIGRQPDINAREGDLASAARRRTPTDIEIADLSAKNKVKHEQNLKRADEMDTFVQAFDPVITAHNSKDYTGLNEAWENAFKLLDENGINTQQLRLTPRDKLMPMIQKKFEEALNNASVIRERVKAEQAHERKMKEIRELSKSREKVAATRAAAVVKPVGSAGALYARIMEKYSKKPDDVTDQEALTAVTYMEENPPDPVENAMKDAWDDTERQQILKVYKDRLRRNLPDLYERANKARQQPARPEAAANLQQQVEAKGWAFEPRKYDYRVTPDGKVQRKAK